jgi:hypothetical protein
MIDVDFHKQPSPEAIQLMQSRGLMQSQVVGERMTTLAGKPGKCVEEIPQIGDGRVQELLREGDLLEIDCWFGGEVEVTFRVTANLKDEFYSVIRGASPVQGDR